MMNCPACENSRLVELRVGPVAVDVCPACRGAWFDPGELEPVARAGELPAELQGAPGAATATEQPWEGEPYACPRCGQGLSRYWYAAEPGRTFLVDGCPQGHGIWLDSGELVRAQEVLRRFAAEGLAFAQSGRLDDTLERLERGGLADRLRREITALVRAWLGR
ncbi:MAG: zf-TFIIB domain-containing protein [bacterium]